MTTAESETTRRGLVRHNGRLVTVSEIPPQDLAAAMTGEQQTGLARQLQPSAAQSQASTKPLTRLQAVAHAVATDELCKGKAGLALQMLADDECLGLSAGGIVKFLQASPTDAESSAAERAKVDVFDAILAAQGIRPSQGGR